MKDNMSVKVYNSVLDYNKLQGVTNPADLCNRPPRDINFRYVTVENSSFREIGCAITERGMELSIDRYPPPEPNFILKGREIRHLAINNQGGADQWLWLLDPESKKVVGNPRILARNANSFVLRDGLNMWRIDYFKRASFYPQNS
jgi:hypothetical protein